MNRMLCGASLVRMEEGSRRAAATAVAVLPDDLILEILARLPVKSLCRCKCVSPAWRALISDPANRRRFAHTLSGLFFQRPYGSRPAWDFIGLSISSVSPPPLGVDTVLSFLLPTCGEMELLDSCNGLLLLCCQGVQESPAPPPFYVVCNPATGEWVTLPQPSRAPGQVGMPAWTRAQEAFLAAQKRRPCPSPHPREEKGLSRPSPARRVPPPTLTLTCDGDCSGGCDGGRGNIGGGGIGSFLPPSVLGFKCCALGGGGGWPSALCTPTMSRRMEASSSRSMATPTWGIEEDIGKETGLPLIVCPTCKRARVIELIVRTTENDNQGRVFFKCPRNVPGMPGRCKFYEFQMTYFMKLVELKYVVIDMEAGLAG